MKMLSPLGAAIALLFLASPISRAVTLPAILGDHMVLQTGKPVPIWGMGKPGEKITVSFAGQQKQATAGPDGRWEVKLDPLAISAQPQQLTVTGDNTITLQDVLVGEVWLCSGQSNMEKPVGTQPGQLPTQNYLEELKAADYPQIRLLKVAKAQAATSGTDIQGAWTPCSPTSLDQIKFSAAGYFFARKLYHELNVPIGVIDSSFGGTRIELWISPAGYASMPSLKDFADAASTPNAKVNDTDISTCYRGMIEPLEPFALRGVLWYQGEANVYFDYSTHYADKMSALVNGWRTAFRGDLPFYYVQIAPMLYHLWRPEKVVTPQAEPLVWEAQTDSLRIPHTGMVVVTDLVDDLFNIHPVDKKDVGERLAAYALANEYGRKGLELSGPLFRGMDVKGNRAILHFDHAAGLMAKDGKPLNWFDVAGDEGPFFPGMAVIDGDTVVVTSPKVASPARVHFAWDEGARANLFNQAGLPAVPFRTERGK
jgi:sialate O-acetylesterase